MHDDDLYEANLDKARDRSARRRTLDLLENLPTTHDIDRGAVIAIRRWLDKRAIHEFDDLRHDPDARSLVGLIVDAMKQSRFDMDNPRTANRILVRLRLSDPMEPRPRSDEFTR